MEEMWSIIHSTGHKLTAGSRPRNEDEQRTCESQSCERVMLTGGFICGAVRAPQVWEVCDAEWSFTCADLKSQSCDRAMLTGGFILYLYSFAWSVINLFTRVCNYTAYMMLCWFLSAIGRAFYAVPVYIGPLFSMTKLRCLSGHPCRPVGFTRQSSWCNCSKALTDIS